MSIHRTDRPNAPYRIRKSNVDGSWNWVHLVAIGRTNLPFPRHYDRGYTSREDAMHGAEAHGRIHALRGVISKEAEHALYLLTGGRPRKDEFALINDPEHT